MRNDVFCVTTAPSPSGDDTCFQGARRRGRRRYVKAIALNLNSAIQLARNFETTGNTEKHKGSRRKQVIIPSFIFTRMVKVKNEISTVYFVENGSNVTLIAPRRHVKTGLIRNVFHYLPKNTRTSRGNSSSRPASPFPPRRSMRSIHASTESPGMCSAS